MSKSRRRSGLADTYGHTVQPTVKAVLAALADVDPTRLPGGKIDYFKQVFSEQGACITATGKGRNARYSVSFITCRQVGAKGPNPGRLETTAVDVGVWGADGAEEAARQFLETVKRGGAPALSQTRREPVIDDPELQFLAEL